MLVELSVENVAIMDRASARFGPGLTAITGETGAGKSLLIGAISLCLGERADTALIRKGAERASVHAVFDAPESVRAVLSEHGYELDGQELILQREIALAGKSTCRINGRIAPLSVIKQVGDALVDLHGQHDHQSLLHSSNHLLMLDDFAGGEAHSIKNCLALIWNELASAKSELE